MRGSGLTRYPAHNPNTIMPTLDDLPTLAKRSLLTGKDTIAVSDESAGGGSKIHKLPAALLGLGYTHAWGIAHSNATLDASTATAVVSVTLLSDIEDWIVREVSVVVTELFAGGSVSNLDMSVGITGDTDAYVDSVNCFTGDTVPAIATSTGPILDPDGDDAIDDQYIIQTASSKALLAEFNPAGAGMDECTAGQLYVLASLLKVSELTDVAETI